MISVKQFGRMDKRRNGLSSREYVFALSLFVAVIIGALAAAAERTTEGYVQTNAMYSFIG